MNVDGSILLLVIGVLVFLVFVALLATAVKAPRFFLTVCGLVALLGFLFMTSMIVVSRESEVRSFVYLPEVHSNTAKKQQDEASTSPPDWIGTVGTREGKNVTHVIEGELYATPHEASRQALAKAAELAREYLAQSLGDKVLTWNVPIAYVHDAMIENQHAESVQRDYGTMYRTHLLMKLTPEHRLDLERMWRDQRIWSAGGGLSLVILLLGTVAGYLKLDDATRGYYSGRLKLAALAVVTGGATAVVAVVRSAVS